ncbi:MAG TPA: hypothetical protein VFK42_05025 [Acidimicrobiales bacterium]|nr:hypothetical protein [Acidimicrobiales bacterium]
MLVPDVLVPDVLVPEVDVPDVLVPEVDVPDVLVPDVEWPQPGGGELSVPGLFGGHALVVDPLVPPLVPLVPFVPPLVPFVPPLVPLVPLSVPQPGGGEFVDRGVGGGQALPVPLSLPANAMPGIVRIATTSTERTNGRPRRFMCYSLPSILEPAWK